jgi:hypothetical protein
MADALPRLRRRGELRRGPEKVGVGQYNHPLTKSPHGNNKVVHVIAVRVIGARAKSSALHLALGIHSERVPHSGAMRYRTHGADVDVYAPGREECLLVSECKSRKAGGGLSCITLANKIF